MLVDIGIWRFAWEISSRSKELNAHEWRHELSSQKSLSTRTSAHTREARALFTLRLFNCDTRPETPPTERSFQLDALNVNDRRDIIFTRRAITNDIISELNNIFGRKCIMRRAIYKLYRSL